MTEGLLIIAITAPGFVDGEADKISEILVSGKADLVHIRKPEWDAAQIGNLIEQIPESLRLRLKLHDHFELLEKYSLGGVHINRRNPVPPDGARSVSRSLHSVEQLPESDHYDYVTLSPIFDSISKQGYRSAFSLQEIAPHIRGRKVVALGGVTPDRLPLLRHAGFFGAAMLGHFWH